MSTPRRRRRNTKTLDAVKAGAIILCMILGGILILWVGIQLVRQREPEPDLTPRHDLPMWESPAEKR